MVLRQAQEQGWMVLRQAQEHGWMVGWLDGPSASSGTGLDGWMVGWLVSWLVGWLVCWLDGWMDRWVVFQEQTNKLTYQPLRVTPQPCS